MWAVLLATMAFATGEDAESIGDSGTIDDTGFIPESSAYNLDFSPPVLWFDEADSLGLETVVDEKGRRVRDINLTDLWENRGGPVQSPLPHRVALPAFEDLSVVAEETSVHTEWDGTVVWAGRVVGSPYGRVVAVFGDGFFAASVYSGAVKFTVEADEWGVARVVDHTDDEDPACGVGLSDEISSEGPLGALGQSTWSEESQSGASSEALAMSTPWVDPTHTIDLLVTYTTNVSSGLSSSTLRANANLGVAITNQAYIDSESTTVCDSLASNHYLTQNQQKC